MTISKKLAALAAVALLAACGTEGGRSDYVNDSAAAPATVITPDNPGAPDSTTGMSQRAGAPGVAGTRQGVNGDSGIRSNSPAGTNPGAGSGTPKRP